MGCFLRGGHRGAPAAEQRVEQVVEPKVPVVNTASIRQSVASLAREKADADKVLDAVSASTPPSSLGYERAHTLTSEHGLNRQFGRGERIHDYYRDVKGDLHLDFSKTQDASYRNEQVVYQTRGLLGRVRQHVGNRRVQTLISEKVRLDCDLSSKLAIDVGQSDTVFISAAHQKGDKQIAFSQKDGGGSLAIVVGMEQRLRGVTFDTKKQIATITTDNGTITVTGVANPNDLRIGRDRGTGQNPTFVTIDAVATMTREGREANYQADAERVSDMLEYGGAIAAKLREGFNGVAKQVAEQVTEYAQRLQLEVIHPPAETSPSDRIPSPLPTPSSPPAPTPPPAPTLRPIARPAPIPAGETIVALNPDVTNAVQDLIAKNEAPSAEEVATAVVQSRAIAQAEVEKRICESMQTISSEASLTQVREWADKNMALFETLNEEGQEAFIDHIKRDWSYGTGRKSFEPQEFFDSRLAFVASKEIESATRSVTTYRPPSSGPGPLTAVTHSVPDIAKISDVVRALQDKPNAISLLAQTKAFKETRNKLPTNGFFVTEPGIEQRSLDARIKGENELAEALLVRALIEERRVFTREERKKIVDAIGTDPVNRDQITQLYRNTYGSDIWEDLRELNKTAIARAERLKRELAEQERETAAALQAVGDLIE